MALFRDGHKESDQGNTSSGGVVSRWTQRRTRQDDQGNTSSGGVVLRKYQFWWSSFAKIPVLVAWFRAGHKERQYRMTKETSVLVAWFCENTSSGGVVLRKYQFWWRGFEMDTKKDNTG